MCEMLKPMLYFPTREEAKLSFSIISLNEPVSSNALTQVSYITHICPYPRLCHGNYLTLATRQNGRDEECSTMGSFAHSDI